MALAPVLLANVRHLLRHPALAGLAVVGIALGVAMSTGIDLAIASAHRAFASSVAGVGGRSTDELVGGPSGIADGDIARLGAAWAPVRIAPVVESLVALQVTNGAVVRQRTLRLTGIDPIAEIPFALPGAPAQGGLAFDTALMVRPRTIALAQDTARELGIAVGDQVGLEIGTRLEHVEVAALLSGRDSYARRVLADIAWCDISTAQELLGRVGRVDRLELIVPPAARARLASVALPEGSWLTSAGAGLHALVQMTSAFDLNLMAMGLLALVVGIFLIFNTIDFLVVQRRDLLARLRLQGASRRAIAVSILGEAAILGMVGSALGVVLGIGCAHLLVRGVTRTVNDLWFVVSVRDVALPPSLILGNLLLGVAAAVLAAALPAWSASRSMPLAGSIGSARAERSRRILPVLALAGALVMALAWGILRWGGEDIVSGFIAIGLGIGGYALTVPVVLAWTLIGCSRPLSALAGPLAAIAARSARATLARTGLAVAALAVASAASLGVDVMVASFRAALVEWLDGTLRADVYVSAPRAVAARINEVALPADVVARLEQVPGIAAVITKRDAHPRCRDGTIDLAAFDIPAQAHASFRFVDGEPPGIWTAFARGSVIITEPFASRHHLGRGDGLTVQADHGWTTFPIAAVVKDYSSDQGSVFIAMPVYRSWWDDRGLSALSAFASPGVSADELIRRMRAAVPDARLQMDSNRDLRRESLVVFDRTFEVTRTIRLLAGGVAFLGVLSALTAQALERAREIATLRMFGATPAQVAAVMSGQALLSGLAAGLLALPLGLVLARLLVVVINRRSFGWSFALQVPIPALAWAVVMAILAAGLASIYPCWRSLRVPPAAALREE